MQRKYQCNKQRKKSNGTRGGGSESKEHKKKYKTQEHTNIWVKKPLILILMQQKEKMKTTIEIWIQGVIHQRGGFW